MNKKVSEKRITTRSFKLIPKEEDENKALQELFYSLGVENKNAITRRVKFSPVEIKEVESIFKKYGVTQVSKIWNR